MKQSALHRAHLWGVKDVALDVLLCDVLAELSIRVDQQWGKPPDVVLLLIDESEPARALRAAALLAGGAPIIAILPFRDARLDAWARREGARACFALGTPLERLRDVVRGVLAH